MKKSVRIRKALPGETPGYYNKTAKFLKKAQMGMQVGSPSMDPARLNQIYENVYIALKQDTPPDVVYGSLTGEYGLDPNTSLGIVKTALGKLAEEGYIDPESMGQEQQSQEQQQPQVDNSQAVADEEQQRMSDDAEMNELAMSDEGYYNDEEALMNDNSHLETEEDEQEQAFRYGGYFQDGGQEEYTEEIPEYNSDFQTAAINQYSSPGNPENNKPFSIEDLMAVTPGMQGQTEFPDISYYLGDYKPIADSWQAQDFLPTAQTGGGVGSFLQRTYPLIKQGFNYPRTITPMTNLSTVRNMLPGMTMVGQGLTKLPLIGSKLQPKLATTFTQNRAELWNILNGASPKTGVFSGSLNLGDGTLQADRLMLYQDDVQKIINQIENTNGSAVFSLMDINPTAQQDGLISGVYPMDAKVIGGTDDAGNKFFEIKHRFGPNQELPFGTTPSKAKEFTVKNRFYYNTDPETGGVSVFDPLGNPLQTGTRTTSQVTRPIASRYARGIGDFLLRNSGTPYPSYGGGFTGVPEVTGVPPTPYSDLGFRGKVGRGLETYATTGLNQFFRTGKSGITSVNQPVYGFANSALGPNVINPINESGQQVASDIKNAINYKYRLGLKTTLIGGGLGYLGYNAYDAYRYPCQCDFPSEPNYMKKDAFGNCPCGTDVGPIRTLDPTGIQENVTVPEDKLTTPDSMQFLIDQGLRPSRYRYYKHKTDDDMPAYGFKKGGSQKKQFVKKLTSMFQEGGDQSAELGKGKRNDTLTNDVANKKNMFTGTLKNNSNKAISEEIYKNAQGNPEIMNLLMKDGYKENLAEDVKMQQQMPAAQFGFNIPTPPFSSMVEAGGFVDMDAENPLTRFIYGGDEAEYYEPYGLPMAQDGISIMNRNKEIRGISDKLDYNDWLELEKQQEEYDPAFTEEQNQQAYKQYEDFYDQALDEAFNYGSDNSNNSTQTLDTKTQTNTGQPKCGPGTVYNATYKTCIPVATINYKPRVVRGNPGLFNTLLPWNAPIGYAGSWAKQMSLPYNLATKQAYMGQLPGQPVARYVTKKGILGRPKKWIDIYQTAGQSGIANPMELEALITGTGKSDASRKDRPGKEERVSKTERIDQELLKDSWNKDNWDKLSERDKRIARRTFAFDNPELRRFSDKVVFKQGQPGQGFYYEKTKRIKDQKQYGGYMQRGGYRPYELGTGYGMGIGQNNSAYNQYSPQSQFENDLFEGKPPLAAPSQKQNDFSWLTGTGTGSYAETRNTGRTLGDRGQEIIPQKEPETPANEYVGVENKRKDMWNIDPEAGVNVFNAGARGVMGFFDRMQNKKRERNMMLDTVDPMNLYASANEQDRGDWQDFGSKSGMFRYDQEGQDRSSRATYGQYGGYMQEGGFYSPYFEEDEEVYMTPEELEQFLAAGGQVEYL